MSARNLPDRPHLDPLRKAAKRLLADLRADQPEALARFREFHPAGPKINQPEARLADAQAVVAREYGFKHWGVLRRFVLHRTLVRLIQEMDDDGALELLRANPRLAGPPPAAEPSALHWAAFKGSQRVVGRLLQMGADPEAVDPKFGSPPVGWANEGGHAEIVALISDHGAEVDLSRAAAAGLLDRVRTLVEAGHEFQVDVSDDWLPLAQAAGWGRENVVEYLLHAGAPVEGRSEGGITALHAAVEWDGQIGTARLLLEAGADPDAMDDRGRSPRQLVHESGVSELIALFDDLG